MPNELKRCPTCGIDKTSSEYYPNKWMGLSSYCIECSKAYCREYAKRVKPKALSPVASGMKRCSKCKETKVESKFYKDKRLKSGLSSICRECQSATARKYYTENRQALIKNRSQYQREHRSQRNEWCRKGVKELSNDYIKSLIQSKDGVSRKEITNELMDARREQIITKRLIATGAIVKPLPESLLTGIKYCSWCKLKRPVTEFSLSRNRPDGLHQYCRDCKAQHFQIYKGKFHEKLLERQRRERLEIYASYSKRLLKSRALPFDPPKALVELHHVQLMIKRVLSKRKET